MPVVVIQTPSSEHATSGKAFVRPGTAILRGNDAPSSQGFASPANMVMTRTLGAKGDSSAAAAPASPAANRAAMSRVRISTAGLRPLGVLERDYDATLNPAPAADAAATTPPAAPDPATA